MISAKQLPWYVIHTKPQQELLASSMLEDRLELNVYLPEVLQSYRGQMQLRPLFPRYLFLQVDLSEVELTTINSTPGVIHLVAFGDRPLPLREGVVAGIRQEVDHLNETGGLLPATYHSGDVVRLTEGPLRGLHAIFLRHLRPKERVLVLLNFLGQENEVELNLAELEPASSLRPQRRRRGTRGKGRKINYSDDKS